ncbi:hypothetical protein GQ43DRAFT_360482, partial [Delitschia confertaspora ATCC 74209]
MVLPKPIHPLTNHCSVIVDQTLYVYSPSGFQSLRLAQGAEWEDLPMGQSVIGGQCVKAVPGGDPGATGLYIVGGSVNETAKDWNYPGLQHYSFSQKKWEWVIPKDLVTQNRLNHAAVYLNASNSILVYSGSKPGDNGPSSQTFVISTAPPYGVTAFSSAAPPAVKPMLMPWDENHAVMFGGGSNEHVLTFSPEEGWRDLGVTLLAPINNQEAVQYTVVSGDDGSKILEKFDMSVSPNKVSRTPLLTAGGVVAAPGMTVGDKRKRVTIENWPAYNGTLAPKSTRTGFSVAQDANGVAVVSGGNEEDPLCMFDQKANAWLNATERFNGQQVIIQSTPSSTLSSTTPTSATPSAISSSAASTPAASTDDHKTRMLTVLGATLGAIFGIAALMVLLLICLRYKREKRKQAGKKGYIDKDPDGLDFADRGAEFMSEAGGSVGHKYSASKNHSQSSLAIISGRAGGNHKRGLGPLGSDASTQGLVTKKSPLGYSDSVEMSKFEIKVSPIAEKDFEKDDFERELDRDFEKSKPVAPPRPAPPPATATGRSRSSGWSRYFANNEATNLAHMPSGRSTYASERTSTGSESQYTNSQMYSQPSQTVPALEIPLNRFDGNRVSQVATGSPTLGNSTENLPHQPMQAELARANSTASTYSGISQDNHYLRQPVDSWTPMGDNNGLRPPSSNYTNSLAMPDTRTTSHNPYFEGDGLSSYYADSHYSNLYPSRLDIDNGAEGRDSTVTVFP